MSDDLHEVADQEIETIYGRRQQGPWRASNQFDPIILGAPSTPVYQAPDPLVESGDYELEYFQD